LAARKKRHPEAAGWLNDAIYAAHDGLGSIFGIVSGVAGATLGKGHYVLIAGFAGMVGSALSTGTGAYLTSRSERDLYDAGLMRERQAVDYDESEAREVLALSLQVRGLPEDVSGRLAHLLAENKEGFVKALAHRSESFRGKSQQSLSCCSDRLHSNSGRRFCSDHPVLLYVGICGNRCRSGRLADRRFCSCRYKIACDRTALVAIGA